MEQLFQYRTTKVRTTFENDQIWFAAKDVAEALGLIWKGDTGTLSNIKEEWKGVWDFQTPGGKQPLLCITEPAVYKLAFRSNKPEAERFTDWIAEEVIPQIRKTGRYEPAQNVALPLIAHTNREIQIAMSKAVSGFKYHRGGKLACMKYHTKHCLAITGKTPKAVKTEGKRLKLPSKVCQSALEVLRQTQPPKASVASFDNHLVAQGHDEEKVFRLGRQAEPVFKGMLEMGVIPMELTV